MPELQNKISTQEHLIFSILVNHTGETLTPDTVDKITEEIKKEIREGPCSWAFE